VKLTMIDNYDSFTYNLVDYFSVLGVEVEVIKKDHLSLEEYDSFYRSILDQKAACALCLSPGPSNPSHAGLCVPLVQRFSGKVPLLGVCLGHQCIGEAFGASVVQAKKIMHGRLDLLSHQGSGIFAGLPSSFHVVRYHSLTIDPNSLPDCLAVNALSSDDEIMGIKHRSHPTHGVQFHPESILTEHGMSLLKQFLNEASFFWAKQYGFNESCT
jgi:anthranilate synthase component 2